MGGLIADLMNITLGKRAINLSILKLWGILLVKKFSRKKDFKSFFTLVEYSKKFFYKSQNSIYLLGLTDMKKLFYNFLLEEKVDNQIICFYKNTLKF